MDDLMVAVNIPYDILVIPLSSTFLCHPTHKLSHIILVYRMSDQYLLPCFMLIGNLSRWSKLLEDDM